MFCDIIFYRLVYRVKGGVSSMAEEKEVKFERGQVSEYNGQSNIFCDFVTVTEGAQQKVYYILNDKKLDNGFYIASTVLKEAIDSQIIRTHLGVIDQDGNVVISFDNKGITLVGDKYLLAVRSEPQSASVLEAIASRNDPSAAANMVNANASIKDKINKKMKSQDSDEGKFILNDLLSEGTVYTLDGQNISNIFGDQYYSFIGMTSGAFYCSTNVPNSSVVEFPRTDLFTVKPTVILEEEKVSNNGEVFTDSVLPEVNPETPQDFVDVSEVSIPKDTIDQALSDTVSSNVENDVVSSDGNIFTPVSIDKPVDVKEEDTEKIGEIGSDSGEFNIASADDSNVSIVDQQSDSIGLSEFGDTNSFEFDSDNDKVVNVVHAVGNVVQMNRNLQEENSALLARISKYEEEMQKSSGLEGKIIRLEQQNSQLAQQNLKLTRENTQLREANSRLTNAMTQISEELGFSGSEQPESYQYKMAA